MMAQEPISHDLAGIPAGTKGDLLAYINNGVVTLQIAGRALHLADSEALVLADHLRGLVVTGDDDVVTDPDDEVDRDLPAQMYDAAMAAASTVGALKFARQWLADDDTIAERIDGLIRLSTDVALDVERLRRAVS